MSLALILAALVSSGPTPGSPSPATRPPVDRSLSDSDRLKELEIAIRSARDGGEIDRAHSDRLLVDVARARRQLFRMGMQVGYRQRVRWRQRVDSIQARLAARRTSEGR